MDNPERSCSYTFLCEPTCILCEPAEIVCSRLRCVYLRPGSLRRPGVVHRRGNDLLAQVQRLAGLARLTYARVARRKYHREFITDHSVDLAGSRDGPGPGCLSLAVLSLLP